MNPHTASVGSIGYDTDSGLGHLLRDYYKYGVVNRVMIVPHPHYQRTPERYSPSHRYDKRRTHQFLDGLSALLLFETAVGNTWDVVDKAKHKGIRIAIIPMYEYSPTPFPVEPDIVLCPSKLDLDYYRPIYGDKTVHLTVPVDTKVYRWRLREKARKFIHNAGHGQYLYAKGTETIIQAMKYVQSDIKLVIRAQPDDERITRLLKLYNKQLLEDPRIRVQVANLKDEELYDTGDVFLNAEQFNGLSLPLQEAHASGMLVMTTNRYPANTWLPNEPLIPVEKYEKHTIPKGSGIEFDRAIVSPAAVANKIDEWYDKDITDYSWGGKEWADRNSWERPSWLVCHYANYVDYLRRILLTKMEEASDAK